MAGGICSFSAVNGSLPLPQNVNDFHGRTLGIEGATKFRRSPCEHLKTEGGCAALFSRTLLGPKMPRNMLASAPAPSDKKHQSKERFENCF